MRRQRNQKKAIDVCAAPNTLLRKIGPSNSTQQLASRLHAASLTASSPATAERMASQTAPWARRRRSSLRIKFTAASRAIAERPPTRISVRTCGFRRRSHPPMYQDWQSLSSTTPLTRLSSPRCHPAMTGRMEGPKLFHLESVNSLKRKTDSISLLRLSIKSGLVAQALSQQRAPSFHTTRLATRNSTCASSTRRSSHISRRTAAGGSSSGGTSLTER